MSLCRFERIELSTFDMNSEMIRIIRLHKRWADGYTLLWQGFVVLLFGGIYFALEQFGAGAAERTAALVLLAAMVLVAAIWQSTGLGIARLRMLIRGSIWSGHPRKAIPQKADVPKAVRFGATCALTRRYQVTQAVVLRNQQKPRQRSNRVKSFV